MASLKTVLYLGVCVSAWIITTADIVPKAEKVHWVSLDFKTILTWTTIPSNYKYSVKFSIVDNDWMEIPYCTQVSESECDLTNLLKPYDRTFSADIQTEPATLDYDYDLDDYPHTYSPPFNPYRESNISAVNFTVSAVDKDRVLINITDPLTSIHQNGKHLSIRDILRNDLKYKISYYKSGSTGKRDIISDSSTAEVLKLDVAQSYCFMVAAYIPSRPKSTQQGAWSIQQCTPGGRGNILQDLSFGALIGVIAILLLVLIIIVTVTVLCCRRCRKRYPSQSSAPV